MLCSLTRRAMKVKGHTRLATLRHTHACPCSQVVGPTPNRRWNPTHTQPQILRGPRPCRGDHHVDSTGGSKLGAADKSRGVTASPGGQG